MTELAHQVLAVVFVLAAALGPAVAAVALLRWRKRRAHQQRKSPLTAGLLRTPGHGLREKLEDLRLDAMVDVGVLMAVPMLPLALFYLQSTITGRAISISVLVLAMVGVGGFVAYQLRAIWRRSEEMDALRLGLDAELAVGQELDQLMREGAAVFHDLPAAKFNIDHVVIAPQGVFAIETKGYSKPKRNGGKADATITFDGKSLAHPNWSSSEPIDQAARQANWLSTWLTGATAEAIRAVPALALPGWFVERKGRGEVFVFSGRELRGQLLRVRAAQPLSAEQMQRVVHQVEQRCRDVEPAFRPEPA